VSAIFVSGQRTEYGADDNIAHIINVSLHANWQTFSM